MLYFCCFPNVGQSARSCMPRKDSEADSFLGIQFRTASPLLGKTAKASQTLPSKLTTISVKARSVPSTPVAVSAGYWKLCIGDGRLRYFLTIPESDKVKVYVDEKFRITAECFSAIILLRSFYM